ncbi:MAG: hypothetical protein MR274_09390 [Clostridium sp.]|nr:hypothetical protein [Clostridium sp.]MDY3828035.1 hypothetical protein [Clostridium sp.]
MGGFKYIKINNCYGIIFHDNKKSVLINNYNNNSKKDTIKAIETHIKSKNDVTFINCKKEKLRLNNYGSIIKIRGKNAIEEMIILDMDLFLYLVKQTESIKYDDIRECIVSNLDIIKVGV